ncbi:MAG: hypothetical protein M3Y74_18570, partial [Chloroflexota bacterium]|nr:hypothetical protein [Chloroflexota bacterium]
MTTADLYLLVAETRCEHGHLILDDAARTGTSDDWIVYLHDAAHPGPYEVRAFRAYQTLAPHLPADWIVLRTRAARHGHDYDAAAGALTLLELARILADAVAPADSADPAWLLHAIHRTGPTPTDAAGPRAYLIELADPATGEVRTAPSLAAYQQFRHDDDDAATPV